MIPDARCGMVRRMHPFPSQFLLRFIRDARGVTAVEFAVIAPVLLLLLMGIVEYALIMLASSVMESATVISSRIGATGYANAGTSREETILASVRGRAGSLLDSRSLTVSSKFYSQFDQINDPEPFTDTNRNGRRDSGEPYTDVNGNGQWDSDMGQAGLGGAGDIVVYTVSYPWHVLTPIMRELMGTQGVVTITSRAVMKNEPF